MKYLTLAVLLLLPAVTHGQTIGRRDSTVADSLGRLAVRSQTGRDRRKLDSLGVVLRGKPVVVTPPPPPIIITSAPPVANFTVRCDTTGTFSCAFDGGTSTGTKLQRQWSCGAFPDCAPGNVATFSFRYPHEGSRTATLTVQDSASRTSTTSKTFTVPIGAGGVVVVVTPPVVVPPVVVDTTPAGAPPTRAELPRSTPAFTVPPATRTRPVGAATDLQGVLTSALPGDSIVLSGTFVGNYTIPKASCASSSPGWITITSAVAPPPAGVRVSPATATGFAKISTATNQPMLTMFGCRVRIVGVEPTGSLPITSVQYGLLSFGDGGWADGGETQLTLASVPQQIILDRVYLHGSATLNTTRCLSLNSGATQVINSYLSDCHAAGFDSQAIEVWNGPGPFLIENNYLEGAGENFMSGGADPGIPGLVPSDITIRRNHFFKPLTWRGIGWSVKNCFELKSAARLLIEGNVFENNWPASQEGSCIVIKANANGCQCTQEGTRDVTFRYNIVRNAPVGLALQAWDNSYGWDGGVHTQRLTIEHNWFTQIGAEGRAALNLWTGDLKDILLNRNTFQHAPTAAGLSFVFAYSGGAARRIGITDNLLTATAGYALYYDGGRVHSDALLAFAADRSSGTFRGNAVGGFDSQYIPLSPTGNTYLGTVSALGLRADGSSSAFPTLGADIPGILSRTAGVVIVPPAVRALVRAAPVRARAPTLTAADRKRLGHDLRPLP